MCSHFIFTKQTQAPLLLGANTIDYGNKTDADIDALRTQGKYRIYAYQGTYWPVNTYGVLYVEVANNYTIQYFIKMAEGITYKRTMVTNAPTPTWSDWIMDYSTDILTKPTYLAPLASALGGITTPISQNDNIDNYRNYGRFTCVSNAIASTLTGLPSGYNSGGFILFVLPSSQPDNGFRIQLITNYRCTVVYIRAYQSNVWEGWRTITTNAVTA